ncbi:hypothetical protein [Desulfonatronovibrio magnus]|uniref:hypothetical protein n=1 Tax=Desulfonatronovibrio magnus TaxID=698827 RepID=UPI0005EBF1CA|nr:hypothetical protein [Desulfonatronovibrio magnus]
MSRRAQIFALVPSNIAGRQDAAESLVAAVGADDQVWAAVDAINVSAGYGMKVGGCHEQQGQCQKGGQD